MCQRAFDQSCSKNTRRDLLGGALRYFCHFIEFIIGCILSISWLSFVNSRANALRLNLRSVIPTKTRVCFFTARLGSFRGVFFRSKSTNYTVNSRLLPLLSLLRSSVSMIPDKNRHSFLLWSELKEAIEAFRSLRPRARSGFEIPQTILLDRNHFLVLVNGRSPPFSYTAPFELALRAGIIDLQDTTKLHISVAF